MEEKKNEELAIIEQVIKLGGSLPMEKWIAAILAKAAATEKSLNELAHFESEIEKAEFKRLINNLYFCDSDDTGYVFASYTVHGNGSITIHIRFGKPDSSYYLLSESCLKKIFLDYDSEWEETARKIWGQLEKALPIISKIRRNILYPEVAEMEKENDFLKSQLAERGKEASHLRNIVGDKNNYSRGLETRLAEKEKEIEKLKTQLNDNAKFLQDECSRKSKKLAEEQHWHAQCHKRTESLEDDIEKAIIALDQTKKIFKSKTIAQIREKLIDALPLDKQTKFICLGCGVKRE